jgi:hypothetical protein
MWPRPDRSSDRSPHHFAIRVEYAVDLMVVLRCTQTLLFRLKQVNDTPDVSSTTRLGDWYGNLIRMGNRHAMLFISERSRLPVMIPVRDAERLRTCFPDAVCQLLAAVGVHEQTIERERLEMTELTFGRTRSRSLLGSLNDFSMMARMHFITRRTDALERIAHDLAETPLMLPFGGAHASSVTRRILDAETHIVVAMRRACRTPENLGRTDSPRVGAVAARPFAKAGGDARSRPRE